MIVYYAHKHGFGHSNSAQEFCKLFNQKALVMTSSDFDFKDSIEVIKIGDEDTTYPEYLKTAYNLPRYAHYLPKSEDRILYRNFQILESCLSCDIKFAMIDVSVETAIQFRIAGIPYAYHKMLGYRKDLPHQMAFEASEFLFAYYPEVIENCSFNDLRSKTHYLGFISRFKFRHVDNFNLINRNTRLTVLILTGRGGTMLTSDLLTTICLQNCSYKFTVVGADNLIKLDNVRQIDFENELEGLIENHDVVISSCGINLTAEILSIKNKFIAIPEYRPFKEQVDIMDGLIRNHLAVKLDIENLDLSVKQLIELPINENLESFFGSMDLFKEIKELKQYL